MCNSVLFIKMKKKVYSLEALVNENMLRSQLTILLKGTNKCLFAGYFEQVQASLVGLGISGYNSLATILLLFRWI